jgi:hypothetical protein
LGNNFKNACNDYLAIVLEKNCPSKRLKRDTSLKTLLFFKSDRRLMTTIILITLAFFLSILSGQFIKQKGVAKYVTRPTEPSRFYRRHSSFSIGLHGQNWSESNTFFQDIVQKLIHFSSSLVAEIQ